MVSSQGRLKDVRSCMNKTVTKTMKFSTWTSLFSPFHFVISFPNTIVSLILLDTIDVIVLRLTILPIILLLMNDTTDLHKESRHQNHHNRGFQTRQPYNISPICSACTLAN